MEAYGALPDPFDQLKGLVAFLLPDGVPQQPAEETDVLFERLILVGLRGFHGSRSWGGARGAS
jgi:hypothetical protein